MNTHSPLKNINYVTITERKWTVELFPLTLRPKLTLTSVKYLRDIKRFRQIDDSNHPFKV